MSSGLGQNDEVAIWAFRYCLGRMTYVTSDCERWLCEAWPTLDEHAKSVIKRDLEEAFKRDDEMRRNRQPGDGSSWLPLGHDCDRKSWEAVRKLYEQAN